ncbi:MAG: 30S ribosomal protein S11 [Pseudomonadota bacterium]
MVKEVAKGNLKKKKKRENRYGRLDKLIVHIKLSKSNTIVTLTDTIGNAIMVVSGGTGKKFKNARKGSPVAGVEAVQMVLQKALELQVRVIAVEFTGFSIAREEIMQKIAAIHSFNPNDHNKLFVQTFTDKTPIAFGGCRARKARRL